MVAPNKSLGQHWLKDRAVLAHIADCAEVTTTDAVLEIGPGLGTLTSELLRRADKVTAVEFDQDLARKLPAQFPGKNLEVIQSDILAFDLSSQPLGYKVVANVPYYITSKIVQLLMTSDNKPSVAVLLIQKEVAERLAAKPGDMSILAISAQLFAEVSLGDVVPAVLFTPPPKVDSQVVILKTRKENLLGDVSEKLFFTLVKAGFSAKRKKLRSSIAGGLHISKESAEALLASAGISADVRAQDLSIQQWLDLARKYS
ncbi:ribosomal RNA small subunit methyltransferase A [Candidatus Saccharibacteria bacterium RIFCSPHIGHO2_01_FULL_45_15]|jgi:16S rRNA (adenine1518-N6/adenine1519-N6)-dimethyltransferase|nr:MAG: ribosomal RNA small subunit methyltransferase A [Candidatus Saccharibacteria bacterium RIFCSPHIGHO2_01_FULL_45_15]OGL27839.1 MAG: ribosomal RNA small subunit methyltransferase A [Candidatus Saccharibacteria bacterium RIFCSPHIGHO2_02_FULL_46_12]OGL31819.1 MAG: ribosomal RNA small subunit methyltransferase A [Candidatus Saccharibacteria bacterium RIFCSPHIGHO2_12_FULL_44_22]